LLLILLSAGWLTGCRVPDFTCTQWPAGGSTDAIEIAPVGRLLERGQIVPDVSEVTPSESDIAPPERTKLHRALTAAECQCAAADHAAVANLIDLENGIAGLCNKTRTPGRKQVAALHSELMAYRSASERNKAAGEALELFYLLAEVEFGRDALAQSLAEIDKIRDFMAQIRASGLDLEIAESAVYNRRGELLDQKAKLALDRSRLNGELRRRLGLCVDDQTPIWPETPLKVEVAQIDVDAAIAEGLAMRPDVAAVQRLTECLDTKSLMIARSSLQAVDAALGSSTAKSCLLQFLSKSTRNCEWANRAEQLDQLLVHLQRAVAEEIRQAVYTAEARIEQIAIAKQRLANRQKTLDDLTLQWGGPDVTAFQISDAKLKVIQAQTDLVHQVVAWQIARAKLKQAQGLFALECGYTEPGHGFVPEAEKAFPSTVDTELIDDTVPPPAPPFADEESELLRQPASITGSGSADGRGEPHSPDAAHDPSPNQLQQPGSVLESAETAGQDRPANPVLDGPNAETSGSPAEAGSLPQIENGPETFAPASPAPVDEGPALLDDVDDELIEPKAFEDYDPNAIKSGAPAGGTALVPNAELRWPPDIVFGEKISTAEVSDSLTAPDVSQHTMQAPPRFASPLRQWQSLLPGGNQRQCAASFERAEAEQGRSTPRTTARDRAAQSPGPATHLLRQPESIASTATLPPDAEQGAPGSNAIGVSISPAEISNGKQMARHLRGSGIRQPESVAMAGRKPHVSRAATRASEPIAKPVLPVSISKEKLTKPLAGQPALQQPESVVSSRTQPGVGISPHRQVDRSDSARPSVESLAKSDLASPSDRVTLRQPMSFASVEILPDEPGAIVRRGCDQCRSAAEGAESSSDQPATPRPHGTSLQQWSSFASAAEQPHVATAAVHRPSRESNYADDTNRSSSLCAGACGSRPAFPPRFVSNAHRHLQPPRISGGCRSRSCQ
jgi:hypothetical protein